ncbi:hypothetical protein CHS0354_017517 [Potamilus streckersoni]|uniref:Uncharacterized protein n=1 Tax=Potamilus streckersoni TaxID=2493646 RepID=A0AAE0S7E6_9BIVA|nr:hypothetical protein CHS0354_017517 [Potamilus streckersoni]
MKNEIHLRITVTGPDMINCNSTIYSIYELELCSFTGSLYSEKFGEEQDLAGSPKLEATKEYFEDESPPDGISVRTGNSVNFFSALRGQC